MPVTLNPIKQCHSCFLSTAEFLVCLTMSAVRFSHVRLLHSSIKGCFLSSRCYSKGELQSPKKFAQNQFSNLGCVSGERGFNAVFDSRFSRVCFQRSVEFLSVASMSHVLNCRMYLSSLGGKGSGDGETEVAVSGNGGGDSVVDSGDLVERVKDTWKSVAETASYAGEKTKETSDDLTPYVQQLLDSHPYLNMVVVPVGGTLTATLIGWFFLPRILRKFHKYGMQGPVALFQGSMAGEPLPYEKSFWGAMEDPVRYLVTFLAFSQMLVFFVLFFSLFVVCV